MNYPDWVKSFRTKGTCVRKVGNNYYLYKHSSKRVKGKKYPQSNDTYIGVITPDGVVRTEVKKLKVSAMQVREYGYTAALYAMCPEEWKKGLGDDWETVLLKMIEETSPLSYKLADGKAPELKCARYLKAQYGKFWSLLPEGARKDIESLRDTFVVRAGRKDYIARLTGEQEALFEKYNVPFERGEAK